MMSKSRQFIKKIIALAILLLACGSIDAKRQQLPPKISTDNLNIVLAEFTRQYDIPALVMGVFTPDTIIMASAGIKDVLTRKKVDPSDRFHIGSCTKAMTAFIAAGLIEEKLLRWDSSISEVFPEWNKNTLDYYKSKTLSDLLSHAAGIQPFIHGIELEKVPKDIFQGSKSAKRQKFTEWLLQQDPVVDPQKPYIYSNAGYIVAKAIQWAGEIRTIGGINTCPMTAAPERFTAEIYCAGKNDTVWRSLPIRVTIGRWRGF